MAISINAPFHLGVASFLDDRQYLSKAEFLTVDENVYSDYFLVMCKDDGTLWIFDKAAVPTAETGKFKPLKAENAEPFQYTLMPAPEDSEGKIYQYIGEDTPSLKKGYWYISVHNDEDDTYAWIELEVQHTPEYTLEEAEETTEGYLKTYQLMCDGEPVEGSIIDIPKDLVIQHGDIKKVVAETEDDVPTGNYYFDNDPDNKWDAAAVADEESEFYNYPLEAGKYLMITITNQSYPIFVSVSDIVPEGTGEITEAITSNVEVGGIMEGDTIEVGEDINSVIKKLLVKYFPAEIKLTGSVTNLVQRLGTELTNLVLTATVTKKSEDVQSVVIDGTNVEEDVSAGGAFTKTIDSLDTTTIFVATANDGKKSTESKLTYSFVLPYYYGVLGKASIDSDDDLLILNEVVELKGAKTFKYTASNQYCVFVMPKEYPALTSIIDQNGFNNTDSFAVSTYTNGDGEEYRVYITSSPVTCSNFSYDFK